MFRAIPAACLCLLLVAGCGEKPVPSTPNATPPKTEPAKVEPPKVEPPKPAATGPIEFTPRDPATIRREESDLFGRMGSVAPATLSAAFEKRIDSITRRPADMTSLKSLEAFSAAHLEQIRTLESMRGRGGYPPNAVSFARAAGLAGKNLFRKLAAGEIDARLQGKVFQHFLKARKLAHHYQVFADPLMQDAGVKTVKRLADDAPDEATENLAQEFAVGHRDLFGEKYGAPRGFEKKKMEKSGQIGIPTKVITKAGNRYTAVFETTKGNIEILLYHTDAPLTVTNFLNLTRNGFFDGLNFHRVIAGFMAQGGDPDGTGRGGPGYAFKDEWSGRYHKAGTMSMANSGPGTNGSQFFMCYMATVHLNSKHTVFGQITKGLDVALKLNKGDPRRGGMVTNPDRIVRAIAYEETPKP